MVSSIDYNIAILEDLLLNYRVDDIRVLKAIYEASTRYSYIYKKEYLNDSLMIKLFLYSLYKTNIKQPFKTNFKIRVEKTMNGVQKLILDIPIIGLFTLSNMVANILFYPQDDVYDELLNMPILAMLYYSYLARIRTLLSVYNPYVVDFVIKRMILKDFVEGDADFMRYLVIYGYKIYSLFTDHPLLSLPYDMPLDYYRNKIKEGIPTKSKRTLPYLKIDENTDITITMTKLYRSLAYLKVIIDKLKKTN